MFKFSLMEKLARRGRVQTILRVTNGSPEVIVLQPLHKSPELIAATLAMVKRGATMFHAKRAAKKALAEGCAIIHLPRVENRKALTDDLEVAGMAVTFGDASPDVRW